MERLFRQKSCYCLGVYGIITVTLNTTTVLCGTCHTTVHQKHVHKYVHKYVQNKKKNTIRHVPDVHLDHN